MKPLIELCQSVSNCLDRLCLIGAGTLLVVNLLTVMLGVFARFFRPPIWTTDLAKVTLVWMIMLAAMPALKRGEHMAISLLVDRLPGSLALSVRVIRFLIFLGILGLMTWLGLLYAQKMQLFTIMSLGIRKVVPYLAIPVGMALMIVELLLQLCIAAGTGDPAGSKELGGQQQLHDPLTPCSIFSGPGLGPAPFCGHALCSFCRLS